MSSRKKYPRRRGDSLSNQKYISENGKLGICRVLEEFLNFDRTFVALGGGNEIGASAYLVQIGGHRILVDAGFRLRGSRYYPDYSFISQVGMLGMYELSCVCITHAHMDHSGSLPAVYQKTREFRHKVPIFATNGTVEIASILLKDTLKIKSRKDVYQGDINIKEFEADVTNEAIQSIQKYPFFQKFEASRGVEITFFPAGHILGAGMVLIEVDGFRILFSGDFSGPGQMTVSGYSLPRDLPPVDLLICETTYAFRMDKGFNLKSQHKGLLQQISRGIERGGKVLIPAFAVGRAQEILSLLRSSMEAKDIEPFPVFSDGMVNQVNKVYDQLRTFLSPDLQKYSGPLFDPTELTINPSPLKVRSPRFKEDLIDLPPCCIVASSGMMINGSCSSYYAEALIESSKNMILFTGYLDEESPGRVLLNTQEQGSSTMKINRKRVKVRAEIEPYHLSAHASLLDIVGLVEKVKPKKVLFVHGYPGIKFDNNLYAYLFDWGRRGIQPLFVKNRTLIYF